MNNSLALGRDEGSGCDHVRMDDLGEVRLWDAAQERYAPAVTGRGLRMDVEKARAVVRELESLAESVAALSSSIQPFTIVPAGRDDVSVNVATQSAYMLTRSREYLRSWHDGIRQGVDALQQQIAAYESVDLQNAAKA